MKGEFKSTMDVKGRMNIPVKLREEIGNNFVIAKTIGTNCLKIYSNSDWESLVELIKSKPQTETQGIQRFLFGSAYDVEADKQGRILVPAALREYASLTTDVVIVGLEGKAEVWDKTAWNKYNEISNADDFIEQALKLGL